MPTDIQLYAGDVLTRTERWTSDEAERRRRAVEACRDRDLDGLYSLLESHLYLYSRAGARISDRTLETYKVSLRVFLRGTQHLNLLHISRDEAALWVRSLETAGRSASTVSVRLAAVRALYRALRWSGAVEGDPFADIRPAPDHTSAADKRHPYPNDAIARLLAAADPAERLLILLAGHAGLRVSECVDLQWGDVDLDRGIVRVVNGKGGKARECPMSRSLREAVCAARHPAGSVLPYRTSKRARNAMRRLCERTGAAYLAVHALRHSAGTNIYRATGRLEDAQKLLGHSDISTTQIYAAWSDERVQNALADW